MKNVQRQTEGSEYPNQTVGYVLFNVVRQNRNASQAA